MAIRKYEIGYDENGKLYKYELDPVKVIRINKTIVTEEEAPQTKSKRLE